MSHENIIRAWKDEEYRNSLSEEQRALLAENPAGLIELLDTEMEAVAGGKKRPKDEANQTVSMICIQTVTSTCGCPF